MYCTYRLYDREHRVGNWTSTIAELPNLRHFSMKVIGCLTPWIGDYNCANGTAAWQKELDLVGKGLAGMKLRSFAISQQVDMNSWCGDMLNGLTVPPPNPVLPIVNLNLNAEYLESVFLEVKLILHNSSSF